MRKALKSSKAVIHILAFGLNALMVSEKKKNTPLSRNAANELHQGWKVVFNRPNTPLPAAPKYQATPTIPWMFSDYDLLVGLGWNSII